MLSRLPARAVAACRAHERQPLTSKPSPVSDTNSSSRSGRRHGEAAHRHAVVHEGRHDLLRRQWRRAGRCASRPPYLHVGEAELAQDPRPRRSGRSVSTRARGAAPARSSASGACATSRPRCMTPTWVQICSTSDSRWVESITVAPSAASCRDQRAHLAGALRVEAVGRLVEDQQVARRQQRGRGERQPLAHAQRVGAVPLAGRGEQADPLQRRRRCAPPRCADPPYGRRRRGGAGCRRRTGTGETPVPRPARRPGAAPRRRAPASARPSSSWLPAVGPDQPEQHPDRGGLAGTVRARGSRRPRRAAPPGRCRRRRPGGRTAWSARGSRRRVRSLAAAGPPGPPPPA